MSDSLTPLIDAYRAEKDPRTVDASALRTRILQTAARRRFVPTFLPIRPGKWLLPIAAAFVATGALAAVPAVRASVQHVVARLAVFVGVAPASRLGPSHLHPSRPAPAPLPAIHDAPAPALSPSPDLPEPPPAAPTTIPGEARLPATPDASLSLSSRARELQRESGSGFATAPPRGVASAHGAARASTSGSGVASASAPALSASAASKSVMAASTASASKASAEIPPPPPASAPSGSALTPDLTAYTTAHHLHFEVADYARALHAWNDYLARYPAGTFAPEARLNRAVCFARLGRTHEARDALTAIVGGKYGNYGRKQAERLLGSLPPGR